MNFSAACNDKFEAFARSNFFGIHLGRANSGQSIAAVSLHDVDSLRHSIGRCEKLRLKESL